MQKFRTLLFPALTLCLILVMGGYYLGRSSIDGPILTTQHAPASSRAAERSLSPAPTAPAPETDDRLDLNRATLEELMTLPKIGEVRAQRILEYREAHGGFHSTAELMQVNGIGEGIYAGLRYLIYVEEQDEDTDH